MNKANLKCPHCQHVQEVEIPENRCLTFVKCAGCKELITAPDGECCVICAYADKKCPIKKSSQAEKKTTADDHGAKETKVVSITKDKSKQPKILKSALIFLIIWGLLVASGFAYFQFLDSNFYRYVKRTTKETKVKDNSANVLTKYQAILDKLTALNEKDVTNPETKAEIKNLTQEVRDLRVLNPYYQFKAIKASTIPTGVPDIYGSELAVSFDEVQGSIDIMAKFGPTYGENKIELKGDLKERYTKIGMSISCEYCCDVDAIVSEDGEAACGCAHSQAMRGLTAYLLDKHASEYSDDEILGELEKWKTVFFPKQTIQKILAAKKAAGEEGIEELLSEFPEFLPDMIGSC